MCSSTLIITNLNNLKNQQQPPRQNENRLPFYLYARLCEMHVSWDVNATHRAGFATIVALSTAPFLIRELLSKGGHSNYLD
ncbi:hypothetical protein VI817_002899 [Penicillium citrinum]|nr:hypothetical protein VI817_002899 [Penicillium citrinum]